MALIDPPDIRRLRDSMAALPYCPRGCPNDAVYESPSFRVPTPDDTIDVQVTEIIARYEREAAGRLHRHLAEDHQAPDALAALVDQAHRVAEADRAAHWERLRHEADAIAGHLTETMLPADLRAAGSRFEWAEQG
ncbi:hypothetical protein ACH40F_07875 [Streptomyces sp. NPDC020794]|uniref:hypothetical protein n=1 Tax=unclassified Streptomyces TaxID=2593676 RepID=UPI0036EC9527